MFYQKGHYYIAYGYENEGYQEEDHIWIFGGGYNGKNDFTDYNTALKIAKQYHKDELSYQREENGRTKDDEIMNTYVMYIDPDDGCEYEMAVISGWRSKVTEYEYE